MNSYFTPPLSAGKNTAVMNGSDVADMECSSAELEELIKEVRQMHFNLLSIRHNNNEHIQSMDTGLGGAVVQLGPIL